MVEVIEVPTAGIRGGIRAREMDLCHEASVTKAKHRYAGGAGFRLH